MMGKMNIQTDTQTARFRHRLYVVLPLFLAIAWMGVSGNSHASLLDAVSLTQSGSLTMIDTDRIALEGGRVTATGATIEIHESSLIAGKSLMILQADGFTVEGWNGVFEADASAQQKLTIAALTTPVLLKRDLERWIVPVGMQLTISDQPSALSGSIADWISARRPLALPDHYLRERLPEADRLMTLLAIHPLVADQSFLPPLIGHNFRLPAAEQEAKKHDASQRLADLSAVLNHGDVAAFDALISNPLTGDALNHADRQDLLTVLSLALSVKRDVQILSALNDADTVALLRFHPLLRDRVSLSSDAAANARLLLLSQMLIPVSDRDEAAVSPLAVQAWQNGWQMLAESGALTSDTLNVVLPTITADIVALDTAGYPERARGYAAALVAGIEQLPDNLSADALVSLDQLRSVYDIARSVTSVDPVTVPAPAAVTAIPAAIIAPVGQVVMPENDVRSMLIAHGCMFTAQSALRQKEGGAYLVDSVVIGTPAGDTLISFTFDPVQNLVTDIEKDGQILPYSLSLEKYLEWVRGS